MNPEFLAFDGEHIWASHSLSAKIVKVRASDGVVLQTLDIPGGRLVFDGTYLWVVSGGPLRRLRSINGGIEELSLPYIARSLAVDGANLWISTVAGSPAAPTTEFRKLRAGDGAVLNLMTVEYPAVDFVFDGTMIYYIIATPPQACRLDTIGTTARVCTPSGEFLTRIGLSRHHFWLSATSLDGFIRHGRRGIVPNAEFRGLSNMQQSVFDGESLWITVTGSPGRLLKVTDPDVVPATVTSSPGTLSVMVDGQTTTGARTFHWVPETVHTLSAPTPQGSGSTRYVFDSWVDGSVSLQTPTITITARDSNSVYTAHFRGQHRLTTFALPPGAGAVTSTPPAQDGFYEENATVQLTPVPVAGTRFQSWSGDATGSAIPLSVTMSAARSINATFVPTAPCTFTLATDSATIPSEGGAATIGVNASHVACTFSAVSPVDWITVSASSGGAAYVVQPNLNPTARSASLTIAGKAFHITQSAAPPPALSANLRFIPLTPCRLLETRSEYNYEGRTGAFGPPYLKAGETRTIVPANSTICSIPTTARAFVLNITLIPRSGVDFVTLFPGGAPRPDFFSIRSPDGQTVANQAIVPSGNGAVQIHTTHDTDMLLDISGYFTDAAAANLAYYPLTPCRVIDTRIEYRPTPGPFGPPSMNGRETRRFRFPDSPHCVIPVGAAAYSATLTVVPPQPLPYMTAWAAGSAQPNVSSINSFAGRTLANNIIVPAAANGEIDIYAFDRTDFIADINGYFAPDNGQGLYSTPVTQCR
ncbi:MAG: BACON domain-containing protein, partial [Bryobacterales bacterium]|nr:BACON domain-containing protein [Bryobacterales bacterium]